MDASAMQRLKNTEVNQKYGEGVCLEILSEDVCWLRLL